MLLLTSPLGSTLEIGVQSCKVTPKPTLGIRVEQFAIWVQFLSQIASSYLTGSLRYILYSRFARKPRLLHSKLEVRVSFICWWSLR